MSQLSKELRRAQQASTTTAVEFVYGEQGGTLRKVPYTGSPAELGYIDIVTLGTGAASKAVILDASGDYTYPAAATIVYPSGATLTLQSGSTTNIAGTFQIGAVAMTSTAAELNFNNTSVAGTAVASKTAVLGANKELDTLVIADGGLYLGAGAGTSVTATAAELNYLDIVTLGTGADSKAVVLDATGAYIFPASTNITATSGADFTFLSGTTVDIAGTFEIANVAMTSTAAELNFNDTAVAGTAVASKTAVLGASKELDEFHTAALYLGAGAGTLVSSTAAELNTLDASVKSVVFEDFIGTWAIGDAGPADFWSTTAGGGATPVVATTVANSIGGEVTLKSSSDDGTNAQNNAAFTAINLGYKANQGGLAVEARLKIDDITEAYVFVGFTDAISSTVESPITFTDGTDTLIADADDACGIVFTGDSTTQEFAHGGVKNTTATAGAFAGVAPVNNTYVVLRVEVSAAGAVQGFVNGTAVGAAIDNAVTVTTALTPAVIVGCTAAAQTIMTIDYVKTEQNR